MKNNECVFVLNKKYKNCLAWTIDDGFSLEGIKKYLNIIKKYNIKITFFIKSKIPWWKMLADTIKPLIKKGNVQIANHTQNHSNLVKLSNTRIKNELMICHNFIVKTYGYLKCKALQINFILYCFLSNIK
jgi:peptidoglycan-N-acetylglucosamine deacetylase